MSFINLPQITQKQRADASTNILLGTMKRECRLQFENAWKKRDGNKLINKSPEEAQDFFDEFGVKAVLAFELHAKLQDLIYMTDNSWVPLVPPYEYTKNEDGTVTIIEPEGEQGND
jgi:hypothetical protein